MSNEMRAYYQELQILARQQWRGAPLETPLSVSMMFMLPKPKRPKHPYPAGRPDTSNLVKAVEDALNGVVWKDDALICNLTAMKAWGPVGSITIVARELPSGVSSI